MEFKRFIQLPALLQQKSHFLFGPRSTGKTFLIDKQLTHAKVYDLLDTDTLGRLLRRPKILSEEIPSAPSGRNALIVIDEIQKLPLLLDEIQRLITKKNVTFLLTGSSARKLKRGAANLLGGRAWEAHLFPLTFSEIPHFSLINYLNRGGLPHIFNSDNYQNEIKHYINLYLREEVLEEALVRKIELFSRFLDVMALNNGEELYFEGLSSDTGIPSKTIQNYIQILEDTLLGFQVPSFKATKKRKAITRAKFYLFDIGITNHLAQRGEIKNKSELFGKCFEHFLMMEIRAYISYKQLNCHLQYWRSASGAEVDCIIGNKLALEFKSTDLVNNKHLKGLTTLREEQLISAYAIVSLDPEKRNIDGITVYPWKSFLSDLWSDKIL